MISEELIQQQGGKFGALTYLRERVSGLPIPAYEVRRYDDLDNLPDLRSPLIVRSSHPAEFWGMAGLLDSVPDVDRHSIRRAVTKIEKSFRNNDLQTYATQRGIDLGDHFYVGIQEQSASRYNGSVMRHPNNPSLVYVDFSEGEGPSRENWFFEYGNNKLVNKGRGTSTDVESEIRKLLDFYEQIEGSELMPGYALQVEFGLDPIAIYQARPFKKIEIADFELPKVKDRNVYRPRYFFGVTDSEGIVLPIGKSWSFVFTKANPVLGMGKSPKDSVYDGTVVWSIASMLQNIDSMPLSHEDITKGKEKYFRNHMTDYHQGDLESTFSNGYAFLIDQAHNEPYLLDVGIPSMKAFLCQRGYNFLTHSVFRQMQNTQLSLLGFSGDVHGKAKTGENVRIISNGKEAVLIKE